MPVGHLFGLPFAIVYVVIVASFILYFYSIFWASRDAEARGKSGCLVGLLVAFVQWPCGLVLWLIFRPEPRNYGDY